VDSPLLELQAQDVRSFLFHNSARLLLLVLEMIRRGYLDTDDRVYSPRLWHFLFTRLLGPELSESERARSATVAGIKTAQMTTSRVWGNGGCGKEPPAGHETTGRLSTGGAQPAPPSSL
jgi:hypothetical protein